MKIATYNIQFGRGRDEVIDLARSLAAVREADILCLQEVDRNWRRTAMVDQPARIMALMSDRHAVFGAGLDVDASEVIGGQVTNRRRQFGNMTLSRWPILSSRTIPLPKADTGAEFNSWTLALETVIAAPSGTLRVLNTHLSHATAEERLLQVSSLRRTVLSAHIEGGAWNGVDADFDLWQCDEPAPPMPAPVILAGDLNAEPDSAELQLLTAPAPDGFGLVDCWKKAAAKGDDGTTFFADPHQGAFHDQRIDYILMSPDLARQAGSAWTDATTRASDHQPVWVTLDL